MTMRRTPYERIRYPWGSDVVSVADVQSMAQDIDQTLVTTAVMGANFSRFASASVQRAAAQSLTKNTLTAISFDTTVSNNGANSPLANGAWFSNSAPTRLTAPTACIVLALAVGGVNFTSAAGAASCVEVTVALNGATGAPNIQGTKWDPTSTSTGANWASAVTMWKLAAGDFLEMKMLWTGTPAGPLNTDTNSPPTLNLLMVGLPSVP